MSVTTLKGNELADELEPYYRSGNDVAVTQATIPAELALRIVAALRGTESNKQAAIRLYREGMKRKEIAAKLGLARVTVNTYLWKAGL